jgi:hypothetical protein
MAKLFNPRILGTPMPSALLTKFQLEKLTNDRDKKYLDDENNIFSVLVNLSDQMILEEQMAGKFLLQ